MEFLLILTIVIVASLIILEARDITRKVKAHKLKKAKQARRDSIKILIKSYLLTLPKLKGGYTYIKKVHWNTIRLKVAQKKGRNAWEILYRKTLTLWDVMNEQ